ncbi:MAG: hypothetical protein LBE09_03910, partial [Christensenellaceae bacterium]|nr:hypothetical protein [Christensenellaceae bacterium]
MKNYLSVVKHREQFRSPVKLLKFFTFAMLMIIAFSMVFLIAMHSLNNTIEDVLQDKGDRNTNITALAGNATKVLSSSPDPQIESYECNFDVGGGEIKGTAEESGNMGIASNTEVSYTLTYTMQVRFKDDMKKAINMGRTSITLTLTAEVELWCDTNEASLKERYTTFKIFGSAEKLNNGTSGTTYDLTETKYNLTSSDATNGFDLVVVNYIRAKGKWLNTGWPSYATPNNSIANKVKAISVTCTPIFTIPTISVGTSNATAGSVLALNGITDGKISSITTSVTAKASANANYYFTGWDGPTDYISDSYALDLKVSPPNEIPSAVTSVAI